LRNHSLFNLELGNEKRNMKGNFKILVIALFIITFPLFTMGQSPPHPNGGNSPGPGNGPVGGGAAIEGGLSILIAMAAAHGARRLYLIKRQASSVE
jgi:hypothetical protein